jgi:hypothetical protein
MIIWQKWADTVRLIRSLVCALIQAGAKTPRILEQENFVVTDGIFIDEHIIFDKVTDEWKEFCKGTLMFDENGHRAIKEIEEVSPKNITSSNRE